MEREGHAFLWVEGREGRHPQECALVRPNLGSVSLYPPEGFESPKSQSPRTCFPIASTAANAHWERRPPSLLPPQSKGNTRKGDIANPGKTQVTAISGYRTYTQAFRTGVGIGKEQRGPDMQAGSLVAWEH
jgi:hypothetical protein